jgi:multidrug resistance efflux pump
MSAAKQPITVCLKQVKTPGTISPRILSSLTRNNNQTKHYWKQPNRSTTKLPINRNYLQVRAPFSGVITSRNVSAGAYVGPSGRGSEMPMFTLQQQTKLRLVVSVPEMHVGYLSNKQEVKFTVHSLKDSFTANIEAGWCTG